MHLCVCLHTYICIQKPHTGKSVRVTGEGFGGTTDLSIIFCMPTANAHVICHPLPNSLAAQRGATVTIVYSGGHLKDGETGTPCD